MKNVIIILTMMLAFPLSNAAQTLNLISEDVAFVYQGNENVVQIYSAPYGAGDGSILVKCKVVGIKVSESDTTYISIKFRGLEPIKRSTCVQFKESFLVLPAKNILEISLGVNGEPKDGAYHNTKWSIYSL